MNAIVTGATKGIGKAIADHLAKSGYNLAINSRNQSDLEAIQKEIESSYPNQLCFIKETDMGIKGAVQDFGSFVLEKFEKVDVLVNNAGVFIPGMIHEEEDGTLEKMIDTNLYSAYYLTKALVGNMITNQSGHIFNICSIASKVAYPNGGSYSISKFAMLGFSKVLREELKDKGIKVTSILPGATWSNSWAGVDLPESRLMQADDIAKSVLSALSMGPSAVVEEIIVRPQLGDL